MNNELIEATRSAITEAVAQAIAPLESKVDDLIAKVDALRSDHESLHLHQVTNVANKIVVLDNKIDQTRSALTGSLSNLQVAVGSLETKIESLARDQETLELEILGVAQKIGSLRAKVDLNTQSIITVVSRYGNDDSATTGILESIDALSADLTGEIRQVRSPGTTDDPPVFAG